MQHVQNCASNAMQDFVRDDVSRESKDDLCDDYSNPRVSDEIDHQIVGQYFGETQAEASGDLKTNERPSSSIDDDLFNIIERLIDNKLLKRRLKD